MHSSPAQPDADHAPTGYVKTIGLESIKQINDAAQFQDPTKHSPNLKTMAWSSSERTKHSPNLKTMSFSSSRVVTSDAKNEMEHEDFRAEGNDTNHEAADCVAESNDTNHEAADCVAESNTNHEAADRPRAESGTNQEDAEGKLEAEYEVSSCGTQYSGFAHADGDDGECSASHPDSFTHFIEWRAAGNRYIYEGNMHLSLLPSEHLLYGRCSICGLEWDKDDEQFVLNESCMCEYHKSCIDKFIRHGQDECPNCDSSCCRRCIRCAY
jgi:hypothetical protein